MISAIQYCSYMEDHVKIFFIGAKKIAKIMGLTQKEIAKKIIGVAGLKGTQGSISSYFTGRTRPKEPMPIMKAIAENAFEITYEEVLQIGREEQVKRSKKSNGVLDETITDAMEVKDDNNVFKLNDLLEAEHLSVIRQFKNKDMACSINKKLVELEALDSIAFAEIIVEIKKKIDEAKATKKRSAANDKD